jgi:hypothetical protein
MKRLFWGFVKIALVIALLVWASRALFPEDSVMTGGETKFVSSEEVQDLIAEKGKAAVKQEDSSERKETRQGVSILSSKEPVTKQQKKYVAYSLRAGLPDDFTATFVSHGTEALSIQIARSVGEPIGNWTNLGVHKKTFWILAELTLQNINVDAAGSFNGGIVEIQDGGILIHTDSIVAPSLSPFPSSFVPVSSLGMDTAEIESPVPPKKMTRRMSARSWEEVLQSGSR